MSTVKCFQSSATKSIDYRGSSSKRLYEFVFKIVLVFDLDGQIDHDQMEISSFDQYETNGNKITSLLHNQHFLESLYQKIKTDGLFDTYPILKVTCRKLDQQRKSLYSLDFDDILAVFERFGKLYEVCLSNEEKVCYIFYKSFFNAFVAMKLLNSISLRSAPSELCVQWCPTQEYENISCFFAQYHEHVEWNHVFYSENQNQQENTTPNLVSNQSSKQCKLTCRYDIQIQNQKEFQVARRIIGSKGTNMKKIIETAMQQAGEKANTNNELLKLRLRGKGSGYKEGPDQVESEQSLHLCISAKDERIYNLACESVEKLLQNVYLEYYQYTKKQTSLPISLAPKKIEVSPQSQSQATESSLKNIQPNPGRLEPQKIEQFLELRNKARRELNFTEADRIRNYLRSCGVCLIDEKGRRGKATEVTTWKYLI